MTNYFEKNNYNDVRNSVLLAVLPARYEVSHKGTVLALTHDFNAATEYAERTGGHVRARWTLQ